MTPNLEPIHVGAFVGFLHILASDATAVKIFQSDTGCWLPSTPLDRMIDTATGNDRRMLVTFVEWAIDQYGREFLPANVIELILKPELH